MTPQIRAGGPLSRTSIVVNGRFLGAPVSGVQRVAFELLKAIDAQLSNANAVARQFDLTLAMPVGLAAPVGFDRIVSAPVGRLAGHLWEQVSLPRFAGRRLTLNLCNLAPLWRPGVVLIHDAQVHVSPQSYSRPFVALYKGAQPIMARRAKHVLTVSRYSKDMLVKYGIAPPNNITVIHNGVDHMLKVIPDQSSLARLGLTRGRYALASSTTQVHKNIGVLFSAFADPSLTNAKLVLIGSATAADFAASGFPAPPNALFAGRVSDAELRALLDSAACLACPSTTEGFGLPPMEAMILGCPAVVAPRGALPEVCGQSAVYADPNDPAAWVKAIAPLIGAAELRSTVGAGAISHAATFTWARSAALLLDVLENLQD